MDLEDNEIKENSSWRHSYVTSSIEKENMIGLKTFKILFPDMWNERVYRNKRFSIKKENYISIVNLRKIGDFQIYFCFKINFFFFKTAEALISIVYELLPLRRRLTKINCNMSSKKCQLRKQEQSGVIS